MFGIFKQKKSKGEKVELKIEGMHCVSCSMNIDGELEDLSGVVEARTSYAKGKSQVSYDPEKVNEREIVKVVEGLGYKAKVSG